MNLLKPSSVEEYVIYLLQKKPLSGTELLGEIKKHRPRTTKQALYAALRKLRSEEIVVMHAMRVSLSSLWVVKMAEFFQTARHFYARSAVTDEGFLNLAEGERVSYTFKSPHAADVFWGHAFDILSAVTPETEPIYIYNPHEWFMLARYETEKTLFDGISKSGRQILLVAGGTTPLDLSVRKEFDGTVTQYHATGETVFEKRNYYANVFGDFLIEALLDEKTAELLDAFYAETKTFDEASKKRLLGIVTQGGTNKITISRNAKKSQKMRRILGKHFYVKTA